MNKKELIAIVAEQNNMTHIQAEKIINSLFDNMASILSQKKEKINIQGFGIFEIKERAARNGKNPRTGEQIFIPAKSVPTFKPSKNLKAKIQE